MHQIIATLVAISLVIAACNDQPDRKNGYAVEQKTKEDSLYHEVMEGHDIGMAKIGKVRKYADQAKRALDSLGKPVDTAWRNGLLHVQEELSYADMAMFKWMEEFKADSLKGNTELRTAYLQSEKEKVNKVKEAIIGSLQHADSLFAAKK